MRQDAESERLWTKAASPKPPSKEETQKTVSSTQASAREIRHRQRRVDRIVAWRARRLIVAKRRREERTRTLVADRIKEHGWLRRKAAVRVALAARREALKRRRYAVRPEDRAPRDVTETAWIIPANARYGRRSRIGAMTLTGPVTVQAVIVGPLRTAAVHGSALHCWDQNVLYLSGRTGWRPSVVCNGRVELGDEKIWFEQYSARL